MALSATAIQKRADVVAALVESPYPRLDVEEIRLPDQGRPSTDARSLRWTGPAHCSKLRDTVRGTQELAMQGSCRVQGRAGDQTHRASASNGSAP